ncbi:MAG: DNA alkylation repair protein [Saccharofermentans sp.]|nr:DNA alkylation repair protein [Saccharofermentans sp.]
MRKSQALNKIQKHLFDLQSDPDYRALQLKTIPGVLDEDLIGVRTPDVKLYAKELYKSGECKVFIAKLPHRYYEENLLHGLILSLYKDYDELIEELERFLPYVDNWAVCDQLNPKVLSKHKEELLGRIKIWLKSDHDYTVRFAMRMLMCHYLSEDFKPEYAKLVAAADNGNYYVSMMCAWYFATALAKNYEEVLPFITEDRLSRWTHNKAIQKAIESYRITDGQKQHLRAFKRKVK